MIRQRHVARGKREKEDYSREDGFYSLGTFFETSRSELLV